MIIVITSDTHNDTKFIEKMTEMYPNAVKYLHAGDSGLYDFQLNPFLSVKGNCDYYIKNRIRIVEACDLKILIMHGDHFPLDSNYLLANLAKENNCNVLIHGHTHRPRHEYIDGVHIICPGSPILPRGGKKTFVVMEFNNFDDLQVRFVEYEY